MEHERDVCGAAGWPLVGRDGLVASVVDRLAEPECHGVLLCGDSGSGRTRVLAEVAGRLDGVVVRLRATVTTSSVPMGVLAPLLTHAAGTPGDPLAAVQAIVSDLSLRWDDKTVVVCVDDVERLDDPSAIVLSHLVLAGQVKLVATATHFPLASTEITGLVADGYLVKDTLEPLPAGAVSQLVDAYLGGRVTRSVSATLLAVAVGSPGLLRVALDELTSSGELCCQDGVWLLSRADNLLSRADNLDWPRRGVNVWGRARLEGMTDPVRRVLEIVAVAQPMSFTRLGVLAPAGDVDWLINSGMLDLDESTGLVTFARPAFRSVVRQAMSLGRRRDIRRQLTAGLDRPHLPTAARVRYVRLDLACGEEIPLEEAIVAAGQAARYANADLVSRVIQSTSPEELRANPAGRAKLTRIHAEALLEAGRPDDCLAALDTIEGPPSDWSEYVLAQVMRATIAAYRGDQDAAREILDHSDHLLHMIGTGHVANAACLLDLKRARLELSLGCYPAARTLLTSLHARQQRPGHTRFTVELHTALLELHVATGTDEEISDTASRLDNAIAETGPFRLRDLSQVPYRDLHFAFEYATYAAITAGDFDRARFLIDAVTTPTLVPVKFTAHYGDPATAVDAMLAAREGRLTDLLSVAVPAITSTSRNDFGGMHASLLALAGMAETYLGHPGQAGAYLAEAETALTGARRGAFHTALIELTIHTSRLWAGHPGATGQINAYLDRVRGAELLRLECYALTETGLHGDQASLKLLQDHTHASRLQQQLAHTLLARDIADIAGIAERAEHADLALLAAKIAAAGLTLPRDNTDETSRARARLERLFHRASHTCGGIDRHILGLDETINDHSLTPRELEIAQLVIAGTSNRDIATTLVVSPRTIEGHLYRIYAKLGIDKRTDITPDHLGTPPP